MKRQLLYYPSIAIPNGPVLRHALLYWDSLLSIVPTDWDGQPQVELTRQMKYLRDEGFYRVASPNDLVVSGGVLFHGFVDDFKQSIAGVLVDRHSGKRRPKGRSPRHRLHRGKAGALIHTGKTTLSIIDHLRDAGLVNSEQGEWFEVDYDVADVYMSLLAKYLAQVQSDPTTCVTDSVSASHSLLGEQCVAMPGQLVLDLRLVEAIPIPSDRVPWEELLAFRKENAEHLSRFRQHISGLSRAIASAESAEEVKSHIADSQDDIEHSANDLRKRMHSKGYDVVLASLKTLLDMKSPAAMATLASCIQGSGLASIPIIGWAGIVSYGLVNLGIQVHRGAKEYRELRSDSPYTYVVDAARRGLFTR